MSENGRKSRFYLLETVRATEAVSVHSNNRKPQKRRIGDASGVPVSIFLHANGGVVISDFFEWMIPIVHSLNPDDKKISQIFCTLTQEEKSHVTLHDNQD